MLAQRISAIIPKLKNTLFSKYALTRYLLLYVLRLLLEEDSPVGIDLLKNPAKYVAKKRGREAIIGCMDGVLNDVIIDLNAELNQVGEDFDYRGKLRDETWVKAIAHRLVADYTKLVVRGRIDSFSKEFDKARHRKLRAKA